MKYTGFTQQEWGTPAMTEHLAHRDSCRGIGRAEAQNVERMKRKVGTSLRVRPGHNPGHTSKKGKEMEGWKCQRVNDELGSRPVDLGSRPIWLGGADHNVNSPGLVERYTLRDTARPRQSSSSG